MFAAAEPDERSGAGRQQRVADSALGRHRADDRAALRVAAPRSRTGSAAAGAVGEASTHGVAQAAARKRRPDVRIAARALASRVVRARTAERRAS